MATIAISPTLPSFMVLQLGRRERSQLHHLSLPTITRNGRMQILLQLQVLNLRRSQQKSKIRLLDVDVQEGDSKGALLAFQRMPR